MEVLTSLFIIEPLFITISGIISRKKNDFINFNPENLFLK